MELQFSGTNGGAQITMQGLQSLFAHLELPFNFTQPGIRSYNTQQPKANLRNDFAYMLPSYPKNDNRESLNYFCPAIK